MLLKQIPRDAVLTSKEIAREIRAVGMTEDEFWDYPATPLQLVTEVNSPHAHWWRWLA